MDEKIKATIEKIKLLSKQNEEFNQEMRKLFGKTIPASEYSNNDERIAHIEKYLGLDYYVDNMGAVIDYSFIQESDVRAQLISDNREMLRFRYGTRFHAIVFEEFCRYAQLQAEMLVNYFYYHKEPTIKDAISHIKRYNPNAKTDDNVLNLSAIAFNVKLWAFCDEFQLKDVKNIFGYNIREVRNNQSHRRPNQKDFSIEEYQAKLRERYIPLKPDGEVDWYNLKKMKENDSILYNIYETKIKNSNDFKLYNLLIWVNKKPFDEIISKLQELADCVKTNI